MLSYKSPLKYSPAGRVLVSKPGLESYLRVQLAKYGFVVYQGVAESKVDFLVTDSSGGWERTGALPRFSYGIVYTESIKERLAFLKQGFLGVFRFPVLVEEIANIMLNHFRLVRDDTIHNKQNSPVMLSKGLELIPTGHGNLTILRYKNRFVGLSGSEAKALRALFNKQKVGSGYRVAFSDFRVEHITNLIYRLRQKLAHIKAPYCIKNIYGFGYFLRHLGEC